MFTKQVNANDIYKFIGKSVTDDLKSGHYTLNDYVDGQGAVDSYKVNNSVTIAGNSPGATINTVMGKSVKIDLSSTGTLGAYSSNSIIAECGGTVLYFLAISIAFGVQMLGRVSQMTAVIFAFLLGGTVGHILKLDHQVDTFMAKSRPAHEAMRHKSFWLYSHCFVSARLVFWALWSWDSPEIPPF